MSKVMLINVILEEESRVAIVDDGILDFFEIETLGKATLKGNIYKGVVENVNSSLQAAFVNCGWDKPGFLPLDEVNFKVLPAAKGRKGPTRISDHIGPGKEVMVQVIRDKFNNKPPSLTTYYSLPGRYLVLTPYTDASGVSRRIEDEDQRSKLKRLIEDLRAQDKYGVIVRTAGLDQDRRELTRDLGFLIRLWETIEQAAAAVPRAPALIYKERGLALRTIRDHLTDEIDEVWIDDEAVYEGALRFVRAIAPHQEARIHHYKEGKPLFTRFNLEDQIETIYKRRVPLKSGGEIVIEGTEAMTAIDVNSSRSRESSVEELALRTNAEAAAEIARQLRLRDIGGLIVVDFIDMTSPKHMRSVEKVLFEGMRRDKAKYDATRISKLGILEISRQRLKAAKSTATYITCPTCDGAGSVRTTEAAAFSALRKIQTRVVRGDVGVLTAAVPQEVALYLLNVQRDELLMLEGHYGVRIHLVPRLDFPKEKCEIEITPPESPKAVGPSAPTSREVRVERPSAVRPGRAAVRMEDVLKAAAAAPGSAGSSIGPGSSPEAHAEETGSEPAMRQRLTSPFAPGNDDAEVEVAHELAKASQRAGDDDGAERDTWEGASSLEAAEPQDESHEGASSQQDERGSVSPRAHTDRTTGMSLDTKEALDAADEGGDPLVRSGRLVADRLDEARRRDAQEPGQDTADSGEDQESPFAMGPPSVRALESGPGSAVRDPDDGDSPARVDRSPAGRPEDGQRERPIAQAGTGSADADEREPGGKKRRRRRGGRGRHKTEHPESGSGDSSETGAMSSHRVEASEANEGGVVWEDDDEVAQEPPSSIRSRAPMPALKEGKESVPSAETGPDTEESQAAAGAKKRRRRRGGRGRKKPGAELGDEPVAMRGPGMGVPTTKGRVMGGQAIPASEAPGASLPSDHAPEARPDEGTGPKKRRRRRRSHGKQVDSSAGQVPEAGPSSDTGRVGSRGKDEDSVLARGKGGHEPEGEEDVPGGWWSRLQRGRKRSDRED